MGVFVKFLVSLVAHLIWQRVGGKGGIPPVRLPRANKPVIIPTVSTWQLMIAMWVMKKFWAQYGGQVKTRLTDTPHPIPRRIGSWLPDVDTTGQTPAASATSVAATAPPATLAPSALTPPSPPAPAPAPHYNTQRLDSDSSDDSDPTSSPARNSLLASLRRKPSGSTG